MKSEHNLLLMSERGLLYLDIYPETVIYNHDL